MFFNMHVPLPTFPQLVYLDYQCCIATWTVARNITYADNYTIYLLLCVYKHTHTSLSLKQVPIHQSAPWKGWRPRLAVAWLLPQDLNPALPMHESWLATLCVCVFEYRGMLVEYTIGCNHANFDHQSAKWFSKGQKLVDKAQIMDQVKKSKQLN